MTDSAESEGGTYLPYRATNVATEPVRLGDGKPLGLSKDGKWALVHVAKSLVLLPTGAGQAQTVTRLDETEGAVWLPDSKSILYCTRRGTENGSEHLVVQDISGGPPRTRSRKTACTCGARSRG